MRKDAGVKHCRVEISPPSYDSLLFFSFSFFGTIRQMHVLPQRRTNEHRFMEYIIACCLELLSFFYSKSMCGYRCVPGNSVLLVSELNIWKTYVFLSSLFDVRTVIPRPKTRRILIVFVGEQSECRRFE